MEDIAGILLKVNAVSLNPKNPYTWASGIRSPIYCDNRLLLSHPKEWEKIIDSFVETIKKYSIQFDVIAGVATSGIPHAAYIAAKLKKPMVYVRTEEKKHGKKRQIEGKLEKGQKAVVIEDLISTGGSSIAVVDALKKEGVEVTACIAIFTYGFEKAGKNFAGKCPLYTLTDFSTLLKAAEKEGKITNEEKNICLEFSSDPENWANKSQQK